ncbi:MAG TPA: hypothetical protein VG267_11925 [Terracidiphilus sp.]|jgi:hypothetical protein|nr:hypothetical protein [Terracidiphilus sp.]
MSFPLDRAFHAGHLLLLHSASLIVPRGERHDWLREWRAELWHIRHSLPPAVAGSWRGQLEITAFCAGCFPDAVAIRRCAAPSRHTASIHGSAAQCILCLCAVLVLCVVPARLLTGVRVEYQSHRFRMRSALIAVGDAGAPASQPSISLAQYRVWNSSRQRYVDGLAFYRITVEAAERGAHRPRALRVAHASASLLPILDLPLQLLPALPADSRLPALIVSREAWVRDFGKDPSLPGRLLQIGGETVRVAGVISYGSWQLPGHPDAWLLGEGGSPASDASRGFVIAHLSPLGRATVSGEHVPIEDDLDGTMLDQPIDGPQLVFGFALFLALLALPAVTSMAISESSFSTHRPSFSTCLFRWAFLAAKFVLIASIAYFASCDLAYWNIAGFSPMAEFAQFVFAFVLCLFALRWAVLDQRQRCPVCLRRVTHPAQVGIASRTFLGWNGTEMICTGGHTLLHVPSLPTSWFGAQRWLYLDASWEFLFAGGDLP